MNKGKASYELRQLSKFLLWSLVTGAVVEYGFFCVSTSIPFIWTAVGLVCWAMLISCSHQRLARVEVF
jgi:hypothetical protein